jgi:hypothetical protein
VIEVTLPWAKLHTDPTIRRNDHVAEEEQDTYNNDYETVPTYAIFDAVARKISRSFPSHVMSVAFAYVKLPRPAPSNVLRIVASSKP